MKRTSWILFACICILTVNGCSQNPLDPTADRQPYQILFPAQPDGPDLRVTPIPMDLQLETCGGIASLCWCTQGPDCPYACRIYRSIDNGSFELVRVVFCTEYCEDLSGLQFNKVSWFVTCISLTGEESAPSSTVSVKAPLPDIWFPVEQD